MKKSALLLFVAVLSVACSETIDPADIAKINGYWEIEKVEMPNGEEKTYTINPVYDYFEIKDNRGFRKKVMPQLDGTYLVNDLSEQVTIVNKDGKTLMEYVTPYARWTEQLIEIDQTHLVVENADEKTYHYKRATAPNLK